MQPKLGGSHILTGPVAVRGAKAGQVLEVRIKDIDLHYDWGYNAIRPLPARCPTTSSRCGSSTSRSTGADGRHAAVGPGAAAQAVLRHHGGGAAAGLGCGRLAAAAQNGGNMDNKELVAGTTLYLPIHVDGALFSVGDGHGVQGDGEVCSPRSRPA